MKEFHIARQARDRYAFQESLFSLSGNVILANFHASRIFAQEMNSRRDLLRYPETAVRAGQINAMGLIDEILHYVVQRFQEQISPQVMKEAYAFVRTRIGAGKLERTLRLFTDQFPPLAVYRGQTNAGNWLKGDTDGTPNRHLALEELIMLWLANGNPAFSPFLELFDDQDLEKRSVYPGILEALAVFFRQQPSFGPDGQDLLTMLQAPAAAHPHSLTGQLEYIRRRWAHLLGEYLYRLLGSLDLIEEEERVRSPGPGPLRAMDFSALESEGEAFSADLDWMPRAVMIAKNAYVWLDQLSKNHAREIRRLDQVPDEELDKLASWGFTALWLIGLWERSAASRRIKQMCGNPEAEASAYSLARYDISRDLGGWQAFADLKERAWKRGIRMAGDMVPNHMGIDSDWVCEHPQWFISLPHSPFPSYSFSGADLSSDPRASIQLEDHYYSRSDAAVVFKHRDTASGQERYIYHGNDGTSMPWNDTAQLDFLNPEVREAVIQTILHVARSFPIIRFDAAMTLTKKHFQRLWFPEPGSGGDIPSRADQGMSRRRFDEAMPREFWREVVERIAAEAPDTLLLAEAFWMLEGYFVRTLGMHRVYNSAFMNMLKSEANAEYRQVIRRTLEFNPEILKRFVNFMNNPDEETAVAQFGKGDKYFGVCLLMATLPGLPMFGHGQVEGFTEKYGMEYRKAYREESEDSELVDRHRRQIFPLLHRRALFAGVRHFLFYDFQTEVGVNQDVFAYTNRLNSATEERVLVVYHNRYSETAGWVHRSAALSSSSGLAQPTRSLAEGLGLSPEPGRYCIFRDHLSGLEYLRSCGQLHDSGLYVQLRAYGAHVFLDFREVEDRPDTPYAALETYLGGRGVPDMDAALREILLGPVQRPLRELINARVFGQLLAARSRDRKSRRKNLPHPEHGEAIEALSRAVEEFSDASGGADLLAAELKAKLLACLDLPSLPGFLPVLTGGEELLGWLSAILGSEKATARQDDAAPPILGDQRFTWACLFGWLFVHALGAVAGPRQRAARSRSWIDEWLAGKLLDSAFAELGLGDPERDRALVLIKILTSHQQWFGQPGSAQVARSLLADTEVQAFCNVNRYQGILWFHGESLQQLAAGLFLVAVVDALAANGDAQRCLREIRSRLSVLLTITEAAAAAGYQVENLLNNLEA